MPSEPERYFLDTNVYIYAAVDMSMPGVETASADCSRIPGGLNAYGPGRDLDDLLIVEAMRTRGIGTLISADRGFDELGVTRRDPREWA